MAHIITQGPNDKKKKKGERGGGGEFSLARKISFPNWILKKSTPTKQPN